MICSRTLINDTILDNRILYSLRKSKATFYEVLNVKKDCTTKELKDSYIKLSKTHHPDIVGNSREINEKFKKITEAYNTLSKPESRRNYDNQLIYEQYTPRARPHSYQDEDWSAYENPIFRKYTSQKSSEAKGYYGIKRIKKKANSVVAAMSLLIAIIGVSLQVLLIKKSVTFRRETIKRESEENAKLLNDVIDQTKANGNDLQIEILKRKFERNGQKVD